MKYQHIPQHPPVIKYFKESFNLRPPLPKVSFVWDVETIFEYFRSLGDNRQITDKHLSQKLLILLLLLGGQRLNSVFNFTTDRLIIGSTSVTFSPEHVLKYSRPGRKLNVFEYWTCLNPKRCVLECVKEYIHQRSDRVNKEQKRLFVTYRKSYHTFSIDTLRRWIKETFTETKSKKTLLHIVVGLLQHSMWVLMFWIYLGKLVGAMLKHLSNIIKKKLLVTKE